MEMERAITMMKSEKAAWWEKTWVKMMKICDMVMDEGLGAKYSYTDIEKEIHRSVDHIR